MKVSTLSASLFSTFLLFHSLSTQICSGKTDWEFGRRVPSISNKLSAENVGSTKKQTLKHITLSSDNTEKEKPRNDTPVTRRVRVKNSKSITRNINLENKSRSDDKSRISLYFASDATDRRSRILDFLHPSSISYSYSYSYPYPKPTAKKASSEIQPTLKSAVKKSSNGLVNYPETPAEQSVTSMPVASNPNSTTQADESSFGNITETKVTCPLTGLDMLSSNIQKVPIRFTYEVDTNQTWFEDIEALIFQSVVDTLLDCNADAQGTRKLQGVSSSETYKFISVDSMPGDILRTNETCSPAENGSSCHIIDGTMTIEIDQPGEEAAQNAAVKVLYLIEGFMKFDLYTSPTNGITAVRYLSPDLSLPYNPSSITSRISSSAIKPTGFTPAIIASGLIGIGVLALVFAVTHGMKRRRRMQGIHSSYDDESSSILHSPSSQGPLVTTGMLEGSPAPGNFTRRESFSSMTTRTTSHRGLSVVLPYGYTEITDESMENGHSPPPVCFDKGFLADSTPNPYADTCPDEEDAAAPESSSKKFEV
mmetsp:Transcript_20186/g.28752  ORF Transcript_20186/g.28752 Transcript_20186/m.28752 type:complete len:537 (-) Transcript_20186:194-1804(-)